MNDFKIAIVQEVQELQKLGACRDYDAVERIRRMDLTEYADMTVSDATDLLLALLSVQGCSR